MITLGIDTSNYTTSVAVASNNEILLDNRILLTVKDGELGLRQSDALYQHWENLPKLLNDALKFNIEKIVVSTRPRPKEGSYMPVFNAGKNIAHILSNALNVPLVELSHQEGHILAASYQNEIDYSKKILYGHLSGGTLEFIDKNFNIVSKTMDISYGQLIDRIGLALGLKFPAGKEIDKLALVYGNDEKAPIKKICIKENGLNISGAENQLKKLIDSNNYTKEAIAYYLMKTIADSLKEIIDSLGFDQVLLSGGVASSQFLRQYLKSSNYKFGNAKLCSDNAVGLALSEGELPWL